MSVNVADYVCVGRLVVGGGGVANRTIQLVIPPRDWGAGKNVVGVGTEKLGRWI